MILKSRHVLLRVVPLGVVLLAAGAGIATAQASTQASTEASITPTTPTTSAVVGTSLYVSPFGSDTSNNCRTAATPCATVQHAVVLDTDSGTIHLAAGAYPEQVVITASLSVVGAGQDESTIQAPASLTNNAQPEPQTSIVDISNSASVSMSKLTVAGPGPQGGGLTCSNSPSSLDKGIDVHGSASLNLTSAAVRNVYNLPNNGCQRGDGISIGSACFSSCTADVGHATLSKVKISVYQKNGIAVRGPGSTLTMTDGTVTEISNPENANNGIEVVTGAVGVVSDTTITGNQCTNPTACGPDPFTSTMATGVLTLGAGAGTKFTGLQVHNNDMGIYTNDGVTLTNDNASNNLFDGIFVDVGATHAVIQNDTASNNGPYGIITVSGSFNKFANDTAKGNTTFDLDAVITGSDTNTYSKNHSTLASPSKAYWHST